MDLWGILLLIALTLIILGWYKNGDWKAFGLSLVLAGCLLYVHLKRRNADEKISNIINTAINDPDPAGTINKLFKLR